ncbi:MAG TPA: response regulator [Dehalococcoidia bacterium]|nr:response regulator [Dehalococcoidia bacterium]
MPKILLVEDNEVNRDLLARRLRRREFDVVPAADGAEALVLARSESPDLILLDMGLPVLDGWETARRLKAAPETRSIPVIALTAHALTDDRRRAIDAGCDDYASKPIDFPHLLETIDRLLGSSKSP